MKSLLNFKLLLAALITFGKTTSYCMEKHNQCAQRQSRTSASISSNSVAEPLEATTCDVAAEPTIPLSDSAFRHLLLRFARYRAPQIQDHPEQGSYPCDRCILIIDGYQKFLQHKHSHMPDVCSHDGCGVTMTSAEALIAYIRTHTEGINH